MTIGIDIGGTKIAAGRISPKGKISGFVKIPTEASKGKTRVLANIKKSIHLVMSENITAIGIGIAGQVDMKNGVFLGGPNLPKAFKNINLKKILEKKYGNLKTKYISPKKWNWLAAKIRKTKMLRNVSTIALPPTGRSALIIDASTGVEPIFSPEDYYARHLLLKCSPHECMSTARNTSPRDHLLMVAGLQKGVDESISKTINLPPEITSDQVGQIYLDAWEFGLKGISIYREGSKCAQPKKLS